MRYQRQTASGPFGLRSSAGVLWLFGAMALVFLVDALLGHPAFVARHLMLTPQKALGREPWQLVTSTFVNPGLMGLFSAALSLLFFGWPVEQRLGRRRLLGLFFASALAGALATALLGRWLRPAMPVTGAGAASLGLLAAFGAAYRRTRISLFGVQQMTASTCALLFLAVSAVFYLMNRDWIGLAGGAVAAGTSALLVSLSAGSQLRHFGQVLAAPSRWPQRYRRWRWRRRYRVISGGRDHRSWQN